LAAEEPLRADLLHYLTGAMSEDARALFEERLLTSQDFSDAVAHHEQELVDAYAEGSLPAAEATALRPWIEISPRREQRLRMARTLLQRRPAARQRWLPGASAAAGLVIVTSAVLYWFHAVPGKERIAVQAPAQPAAGAVAGGHRSPQPQVVLLVAERIRGAQPLTTYHVRPEAPVELQVLLADEAAQASYTIEITSSGALPQVHWKQTDLKPQVQGEHFYLDAIVPPGALPPATYTAVVGGAGTTLVARFTVAR
jgi:hypothetical protein